MFPFRSGPEVASAEQLEAELILERFGQMQRMPPGEVSERLRAMGTDPDDNGPPNFLLRQISGAVELSLQSLLWSRSQAEIEAVVDNLLLLDYRMNKATTEEEREQALEVLRPAHRALGKTLRLFNEDSFDTRMESLYLKLGPLLSQVPLRIYNRIYALLRFDKDDFKLKLSFRDDTLPSVVTDRVCAAMASNNRFTSTLTEKLVREAMHSMLGDGLPYTAVPLTPPMTSVGAESSMLEEPSTDEASFSDEGEEEEEEDVSYTDVSSQPAQMLTSHADHVPGEANGMCLDCYRLREEVQEDMITALAESTEQLEAHNNTLIREIFNPI